jgi:hypothetical protein
MPTWEREEMGEVSLRKMIEVALAARIQRLTKVKMRENESFMNAKGENCKVKNS